MSKKRLYVFAQFDTYRSSGSVGKGLLQGLQSLQDVYDLYYVNTYNAPTVYGDFNFELSNSSIFGEGAGKGWTGFDGYPKKMDAVLFYGYSPVGSALYRKLCHDTKVGTFVGYLIAESATIPKSWVQALYDYDHIFVPSKFVERAFENSAACYDADSFDVPIDVVPHGIDDVYFDAQEEPFTPDFSEGFKLLHITGARDFPHRKGTVDLLRVLREFFVSPSLTEKQKDSLSTLELLIRTPKLVDVVTYGKHIVERLAEEVNSFANREVVRFDVSEDPMPPEEMLKYYREKGNVLIQPSRAEAFGLCPLEAYMAGLPVFYTDVTGSRGFRKRGYLNTVIKDRREYGPIKVQGIEHGVAPIVTPDIEIFIGDMLNGCYLYRKDERINRADDLDGLRWEHTTEQLRDYFRGLGG